jgi:hypothetical protein
MRKIILSLIGLIIIPISVNAAVNGDTKVIGSAIADNANIKKLCQEAETENSGYTNSQNGYYLECIAIKCVDGKNVHNIENGFLSTVTCANGNKNPKRNIVNSGADVSSGQTLSLANNESCAPDDTKLDSSTGAYAFATRLYSYDCAYNADGSAFNSEKGNTTGDNTSGSNTSGGNKDDNTTTTTATKDNSNPKTGIQDYYNILIPSIIIVSGALYLVNKKNIFKKI